MAGSARVPSTPKLFECACSSIAMAVSERTVCEVRVHHLLLLALLLEVVRDQVVPDHLLLLLLLDELGFVVQALLLGATSCFVQIGAQQKRQLFRRRIRLQIEDGVHAERTALALIVALAPAIKFIERRQPLLFLQPWTTRAGKRFVDKQRVQLTRASSDSAAELIADWKLNRLDASCRSVVHRA